MNVIIIDDDPVFIMLHRETIISSGFCANPVGFSSGQEFLDSFLAKESFQAGENYLLFLDIHMPLVNGWDVIEALEKYLETHDIKIVMVSSSINIVDKRKAATYPQVIDFIEKPLRTQHLKQLVG